MSGKETVPPRHTQKSTAQQLSPTEKRLKEQVQKMQTINLEQAGQIKSLQKVIHDIGDDLVAAGNTPDQIRVYWAGYKSPQEREE